MQVSCGRSPYLAKCSLGIVLIAAVILASPVAGYGWDPIVAKDVNAAYHPALVKDVMINDAFWGARQVAVRDHFIPWAWSWTYQAIVDAQHATWPDHPPTGHQWEQLHFKEMEACSYALAQWPNLPDIVVATNGEWNPTVPTGYANLAARLNDNISILAAAQTAAGLRDPAHDGYLRPAESNKYPNCHPWTDNWGRHDGYIAGHLYEAAVAHYVCTGQSNFLNVAKKSALEAYNWFITGNRPGFCGHVEIEPALIELYRVTGDTRFRDLGQRFVAQRGHNNNGTTANDNTGPGGPGAGDTWKGYFQDDLPIEQQTAINGHAVRATFFYAGVADSVLTGRTEWYNPMARVWKNCIKRKVYVNGAVGSVTWIPSINLSEGFSPNDYELPNDNADGCYCESCASSGQALLAWRMARLKGDVESVDELERTMYNAVMHALSNDGTGNYYGNPIHDHDNPHYNNWVCCPPTISRTVLGLGRFVYGFKDNDIFVNLFVGSTCTFNLTNGTVPLTMATNNYPWDGRITITVTPATPTRFAMHVRVPGWCRNALLRLNGKLITRPTIVNRYIVLDRQWSPGDVVVLNLAMTPMRIEAHPNVAANVGRVCIQRGPIIFGLEGIDNGGGSYATDPVLSATPNLRAVYNEDLLGGVQVITANKQGGGVLTFIPWYVMAQRSNSWQKVWILQENKTIQSTGWEDRLYREYQP